MENKRIIIGFAVVILLLVLTLILVIVLKNRNATPNNEDNQENEPADNIPKDIPFITGEVYIRSAHSGLYISQALNGILLFTANKDIASSFDVKPDGTISPDVSIESSDGKHSLKYNPVELAIST